MVSEANIGSIRNSIIFSKGMLRLKHKDEPIRYIYVNYIVQPIPEEKILGGREKEKRINRPCPCCGRMYLSTRMNRICERCTIKNETKDEDDGFCVNNGE